MAGAIDARFTIDDAVFKRRVAKAIERGRHPKPVLEVIGTAMTSSMAINFYQQGRPTPWKPLAMSTLIGRAGGTSKAFKKAARKKREYSAAGLTKRAASRMGSAQILMDRGSLLRSIHHRATDDMVEAGSNLVYARIHHFGGMAGRGHQVSIPARPWALIQDPEDKEDFREILEDYFMGPLGGFMKGFH